MAQAKKLKLVLSSNFSVVEKAHIKALCKQFGLKPEELDRPKKARTRASSATRKKHGKKKPVGDSKHKGAEKKGVHKKKTQAGKPTKTQGHPKKRQIKKEPQQKKPEPVPKKDSKPSLTPPPSNTAVVAKGKTKTIFEVKRRTPRTRRIRIQPSRRTSLPP